MTFPSVVQDKSDDLEQSPTRLDDLKFVLSTISEIKIMSLDVETRIRDITEKYRTLSMYGIEVSYHRLQFKSILRNLSEYKKKLIF